MLNLVIFSTQGIASDKAHIGSSYDAKFTKDIEELFDEFFRWRMIRSPEFSTLIGLKDYNDILETFTEDRFTSDLAFCEGKVPMNVFISSSIQYFLDQRLELELKDLRTRQQMSHLYWIFSFLRQNFKHLLMDSCLKDSIFLSGKDGNTHENAIKRQHHAYFWIICSYLEGVQVDFQRLAEWTTFEVYEDYEDLISRYNVFDVYVQQGKIDYLKSILKCNHYNALWCVGGWCGQDCGKDGSEAGG